MADLIVDDQVFMTHCHTVPKGQTIGTTGLFPCLGVIAQLKGGDVFCGHLACNLTGDPKNQKAITTKAAALIADQLKNAATVQAMTCASTNFRDKSTAWLLDGVRAFYKDAKQLTGAGIWWDGAKAAVIGDDKFLVGKVKGPQGEDGPFQVK